ncbi:hypothetical protein BD626DRAFT_574071 [Schizophyllum amplum]|uniref:Guanine nucleotide exchange factor Vps9 n=1 Tax=Schizophyllum amplum TaxID=97359 RepID=A0A550BZK7_9AGAR|nr:hypothetical protein BD626DRAFT_574071 [Auriculariopsis ampla]
MSSDAASEPAPITAADVDLHDELASGVHKMTLSSATSAAPAAQETLVTAPASVPPPATPDPNPWRTATLQTPQLSETQTQPPQSATPNPWQPPTPMLSDTPTGVPDSSTMDPEVASSASAFQDAQRPLQSAQEKEILAAFDPYAQVEREQERKAWDDGRAAGDDRSDDVAERKEGVLAQHAEDELDSAPPATPSKTDAPPEPPSKTHTPSSSGSGFPSLNFSSIARSFSISSLGKDRARPVSLDAKPQPANVDPRMFSSSAQEQQGPSAQDDDTPPGEGTAVETSDHGRNESDGEPPPFDFQKFLEQMNSKSAEPVSKYLKSFLSNFAKRTFTVNDQIKIINDFLNFIAQRMRTTDPWRKCTEQEFDNAMEGMEKLVMNRLYDFTFTPSIPHLQPSRPVTTDDLERDRVLSQRIALFGWVEEKHLDIDLSSPDEGDTSSANGFLMFAQQELLKMNHYKAPRDKVICILNCCKVIFGLIRHLKKDESADAFIPLLIFVVLKANPEHLLSNVEFIQRFRNPAKLQSEAGYYLSSLMGAVSFIETMDHTSLSNITQEDFERNVEQAIQSLPRQATQSPPLPSSGWSTPTHQRTSSTLSERPRSSSMASLPPRPPSSMSVPSSPLAGQMPPGTPHAGEESATPLSLPSIPISDDARRLFQKTGDTISKPLNAIGRIFSEVVDGVVRPDSPPPQGGGPSWAHPDQVRQYIVGSGTARPQTPTFAKGQPPIQTPYKPRVRRVQSPAAYAPGYSPAYVGADETPTRPPPSSSSASSFLSQATSFLAGTPPPTPPPRRTPPPGSLAAAQSVSRTPTPGLDIPGVQAQIDLATARAAEANQATLIQIFPGMDREVVQLVLEANENDVGKSIEKLLEMTAGS